MLAQAPWAGRPGPETRFGGRGGLQAGPRPGGDERCVGGGLTARCAEASDRAPRTRTGGGRWPEGSPQARGEGDREHAVGTRWPPGATGPLAAPYRAKRSPAVGAGVRRGRAPHRTRAVRHRSLPRYGSSRPNRPKLGRPSPRARASDRAGLAGRRDRGAACQTAEPAQPACCLPGAGVGGRVRRACPCVWTCAWAAVTRPDLTALHGELP